MATGADTGHRLEDLAQELFEVVTHLCLSTLRGRRRTGDRRGGDLKEVEFLTLSLLHSQGSMIVGDIQRLLGILPAQMSRIIRALENREQPLIECRINPRDKRKIDVALTPHGDKTLLEYQEARIGPLVERLQHLSEDEHDDLLRLLHKLQELM